MKLHNAMWPGLVGKEPGSDHPPIPLERLLDLTTSAEIDGRRFDGVDLSLLQPHLDPDGSEDAIKVIAERIAAAGLKIGSLVAPVWPGAGGGCAFGSEEDRRNFLLAIKRACRIACLFNAHGVRDYGIIRIDSAGSPADWAADPAGNTRKLGATFREAGKIAEQHGESLAAEGEICWGGMHSWQAMLDTLEATALPETVGFQADLAHTYLYLLGYNAPASALLQEGYGEDEFWAAYQTMTDALRPWTIDFHVAQNDGTVHGTGSHDKTGRHCRANDPNGKLDIAKCAGYWLRDHAARGMHHICWDGCMFPNDVLESPETWQEILQTMIHVDNAL